MAILKSSFLENLKRKSELTNKILQTFNSEGYYIIVSGKNVIFNDHTQEALKVFLNIEHPQDKDFFIVLEEIMIVFSNNGGAEFSRVDFIFKPVKSREYGLLGCSYSNKKFCGVVELPMDLDDILGKPKDHVKLFKLHHETLGSDYKLSLHKYGSDVCGSICF